MTRDRPSRSDEFCVIHGYEHMRSRFGDPVAYCAECEREREIAEANSPTIPIYAMRET